MPEVLFPFSNIDDRKIEFGGDFIEEGYERRVFRSPLDHIEAIGYERYLTNSDYMKAYFYLAKILHHFFPKNFPQVRMAMGGDKAQIIMENVTFAEVNTWDKSDRDIFNKAKDNVLEKLKDIGIHPDNIDTSAFNWGWRDGELVYLDKISAININVANRKNFEEGEYTVSAVNTNYTYEIDSDTPREVLYVIGKNKLSDYLQGRSEEERKHVMNMYDRYTYHVDRLPVLVKTA